MKESITILAIESSCDDTSCAVIRDAKVLSNLIANQKVHENYGGVVPELASRAHQRNIVPVVSRALSEAGVDPKQLDAIAYTRGPGLMGSLLVGASFAKSYAQSLEIPLIEVNHLQAHILCHFIDQEGFEKPPFPFLCLTVSGGHTQIVLVEQNLEMKVVGSTLDDAAGEAFDKIGKAMGLGYPAGPIIDTLAQKGEVVFEFPKPKVPDYNYSFSGLKTAVMNFIHKNKQTNPDFVAQNLENLCASVQHSICSILLEKLVLASKKYQIKDLALSGGVSANSYLAKQANLLQKQGYKIYIPHRAFTTDNAAMIAIVGQLKFERGLFSDVDAPTLSRYPIETSL